MQVEVEGEDIDPDQVTKSLGWRIAGEHKAQPRKQDSSVMAQQPKSNGATRQGRAKDKVIKNARMPALPREDTKIVLRPRGGLDISKTGHIEVGRAVYKAAGITRDEGARDVICPNYQQNIIVVSTPKRDNADKYVNIEKIVIRETA